MTQDTATKTLLFGGGGCHDYRAICPLLQEYLAETGEFAVDYVAEDYDALLPEHLAEYALIVVYHTGGKLAVEHKRGLVEWVGAGNGFVGVHSAADSWKNAPEYIAMLGGVFKGHPPTRDYIVNVTDYEHPITAGISGYEVKDWEKWPVLEFPVCDEQYLTDYDPRVTVLAAASYSGIWPYDLSHGVQWPVAWVKAWGEGRVFYLALGHNIDACRNPFFKTMFTRGAMWAGTPPPTAEDE